MRRFFVAVLLSIAACQSAFCLELESGAQTKSFSVTRGGLLEVSVSGGDVVLSPWEKNEVFVKADGIDRDEISYLRMSQTGNTVRVEFRPRRNRSDRLRWEINLPSQFNTDIRTGGGNIEIRGSMSGSLTGSTSGGDIRVGDVNGKMDMRTSGGNMSAGKIHGDALMKTSGGDIAIDSAGGQVEISTSGGNIAVGNVGKTLRAHTSGGNIAIGDVGGEADVSTSGGNVAVGKVSGNASLRTSGGNVSLRGGAGTITAHTSGGDIGLENISGVVDAKTSGGNIGLRNVSGSVNAKTAGGNIEAELIPSGKGPSTLVSAGGEIRLYLPDNARVTVEALIRIEGRWSSRSEKYDIHSDFKLDTHAKDDRGVVRAVINLNGGGEKISLETVNSNIEIRRLGSRR
ncbi:MAG TPA: hypothetical protein VGL91_03735 [Acidobacteriota bacterium]